MRWNLNSQEDRDNETNTEEESRAPSTIELNTTLNQSEDIVRSRFVPEPCFDSFDGENTFHDCIKDEDIDDKNEVFDDRVATRYPTGKSLKVKFGKEDELPAKSDIESWINRALPPQKWGSMVIEPHPLVKQRMSRMLSIRPREITNVWSGGLFGCFDDGAICILTCFCPCVQFGLNMAYNEHDHLKCCNFECCTCRSKAFFSSCIIQAMIWFLLPLILIIPFFILHYNVCEGERGFPFDGAGPFDCKYWWLTGGFSVARIPILVFMMMYGGYYRKLMRHKHQLPNDPFGEYFNYICLSFCAICQEARTIKHLERRKRLNVVLEEIEEENQSLKSSSRDGRHDTCMVPPSGGDVITMEDMDHDVVVGVPIKAGDGMSQNIDENQDDDVPLAVVIV